MKGILEANSLVDWLNEDIKDPKTHEWGWDRRAFFGPRSKVRFGEKDAKWQERVDAAEPVLKALVASRARKHYDLAGPNIILIEINHGTKRKLEEIEEEEEEKEEEEEEEPPISAEEIWHDQVIMTRKYLTGNHRQMKAQGVDLPYFKTYRSFRC